jgi:hypothetical protein
MIALWKVRVAKIDGTVSVYDVSPRVIVAFERNFKTGLAQAFAKEQKYEHTFWLAWEAEKQSGAVVKPFDSWLEGVAGVDVDVEKLPFDETV